MKQYPSISDRPVTTNPIYAFDKLDGSNIRVEWSPKQGFYKFGTRKRLLTAQDEKLGKAISIFKEIWEPVLPKIFARQRWHHGAILFFEFYGPKSFAGHHAFTDAHRLSLIDVNPYKQGLLPPKEFADIFGELDSAKLLYQGDVTPEFIQSVRSGTLSGMSFEGVVCKAHHPKKGVTMFKLKNQAWYDKLKEVYKDNPTLIEELA